MLGYIKKLFGIDQPKPETVAPYKVETPKVESLPADIKSVVVTPSAVVPESIKPAVESAKPAKAKAPAKPRAEKKPAEPKKPAPKKPAKPRAPKNTAAK